MKTLWICLSMLVAIASPALAAPSAPSYLPGVTVPPENRYLHLTFTGADGEAELGFTGSYLTLVAQMRLDGRRAVQYGWHFGRTTFDRQVDEFPVAPIYSGGPVFSFTVTTAKVGRGKQRQVEALLDAYNCTGSAGECQLDNHYYVELTKKLAKLVPQKPSTSVLNLTATQAGRTCAATQICIGTLRVVHGYASIDLLLSAPSKLPGAVIEAVRDFDKALLDEEDPASLERKRDSVRGLLPLHAGHLLVLEQYASFRRRWNDNGLTLTGDRWMQMARDFESLPTLDSQWLTDDERKFIQRNLCGRVRHLARQLGALEVKWDIQKLGCSPHDASDPLPVVNGLNLVVSDLAKLAPQHAGTQYVPRMMTRRTDTSVTEIDQSLHVQPADIKAIAVLLENGEEDTILGQVNAQPRSVKDGISIEWNAEGHTLVATIHFPRATPGSCKHSLTEPEDRKLQSLRAWVLSCELVTEYYHRVSLDFGKKGLVETKKTVLFQYLEISTAKRALSSVDTGPAEATFSHRLQLDVALTKYVLLRFQRAAAAYLAISVANLAKANSKAEKELLSELRKAADRITLKLDSFVDDAGVDMELENGFWNAFNESLTSFIDWWRKANSPPS